VTAVKTKIILTEQPAQITAGEDLENEMIKASFLALKQKGLLTQKQCEECIILFSNKIL